jgi:hypothetical protein
MAADTVACLEAEVGGHAKAMAIIDSEPEIDLAALATISAPALVLEGDRDEVTSSTGPRLPPLWEMAGSGCFQAHASCPGGIR